MNYFLPFLPIIRSVFSLLSSNTQMLFDESEIAQSNKNKEIQQRRYVYQKFSGFHCDILVVIQMRSYIKQNHIIQEKEVHFKKFHLV